MHEKSHKTSSLSRFFASMADNIDTSREHFFTKTVSRYSLVKKVKYHCHTQYVVVRLYFIFPLIKFPRTLNVLTVKGGAAKEHEKKEGSLMKLQNLVKIFKTFL